MRRSRSLCYADVVSRMVAHARAACRRSWTDTYKRPPGLRAGSAFAFKPCGTTTAPAPAKPATTGAATAPQVAKTNLNTATAVELDKLPQIGPARSKTIIEARAKAKFKNWDDFVARKVVPADAAAAIKDVVSF